MLPNRVTIKTAIFFNAGVWGKWFRGIAVEKVKGGNIQKLCRGVYERKWLGRIMSSHKCAVNSKSYINKADAKYLVTSAIEEKLEKMEGHLNRISKEITEGQCQKPTFAERVQLRYQEGIKKAMETKKSCGLRKRLQRIRWWLLNQKRLAVYKRYPAKMWKRTLKITLIKDNNFKLKITKR